MNALGSIGQSGMNAAMLQLGASAHNVANAQTPGFRRQEVQQQTQAAGGVTASLSTSTESADGAGLGDRLAEDMVQQMSASYAFKANLKVVQTADHLMGRLLDVMA